MTRGAALFLACVATAGAQNLAVLENEIREFVKEANENNAERITNNLLKAYIYREQKALALELQAFRRTDLRIGASSQAAGSTSAVLSPLLPAIFGVAIENGAITRTVNGTTITLKASPAGLLCSTSDPRGTALRDEDSCRTLWKRVGLSASFDMSRGAKPAELTTLQTTREQFAEFTAQVEILNRRKVTGAAFSRQFGPWLAEAKVHADAFARATGQWSAIVSESPAVEAITRRLKGLGDNAAWKQKTEDERVKDVEKILNEEMKGITTVPEEVDRFAELWKAALRANRKLQNAILNAPVMTAEYTLQKPDIASEPIGTILLAGTRPPSLHTARVTYAQGWGDRSLDIQALAAFDWFQGERAGMPSSFRDARFGIEGKFRVRDIANYGPATLSFAGLFVHLHQAPLGFTVFALDPEDKLNKPGNIGVFQTKLELPAGNNALRIPISFTYANRTELIKESDVRGQFGLSFNLDALFK